MKSITVLREDVERERQIKDCLARYKTELSGVQHKLLTHVPVVGRVGRKHPNTYKQGEI